MSLQGLAQLRELTTLKQLDLYQVEISEADLTGVRAALPGVEISRTPIAEKYQEMFLEELGSAHANFMPLG